MCAPAEQLVRIFSTHYSESASRTSLNLSAIPDVTQVTATLRGLRDTAAVDGQYTLTHQMRNIELKITNTDIPRLAKSVVAARLERLTAYPLARLCEWAPVPRKQIRSDPAENRDDDTQD